jgi:hypothetical protein
MQTYGGKPLYFGAAAGMSGVVVLRLFKMAWDLREGTYFDTEDSYVESPAPSPRFTAAELLSKSSSKGELLSKSVTASPRV